MSGKRSKLSKDVAIVGIGHGKFGRRSDASLRELAFEAVKECLNDAGVGLEDVDSMVTGMPLTNSLPVCSLLPRFMTILSSIPDPIFAWKEPVPVEAWQ